MSTSIPPTNSLGTAAAGALSSMSGGGPQDQGHARVENPAGPTATERFAAVELVRCYEQPAWRRVLYLAASRADAFTYRTRAGRAATGLLDRVSTWRHARGCADDCAIWYQRLPRDPPGRFPKTADRAVPGCGFLPLSVRVDLRIYDLSVKGATLVAEYTATSSTDPVPDRP